MARSALVASSFLALFGVTQAAPNLAQASQMSVNTRFVQFRDTAVGTRRTFRLIVRNHSSNPIPYFEFMSWGDKDQFRINNPCSRLPGFGTCFMEVEFTPKRAGRFAVEFAIQGGFDRATVNAYGDGFVPQQ